VTVSGQAAPSFTKSDPGVANSIQYPPGSVALGFHLRSTADTSLSVAVTSAGGANAPPTEAGSGRSATSGTSRAFVPFEEGLTFDREQAMSPKPQSAKRAPSEPIIVDIQGGGCPSL